MRTYSRGETLVLAGQSNRRVGVVLSGAIEAYHPAASGARLPISQMGPGGVFGDVLGGSSLSSPVTVMASAPCEVLLVPYEKLLLPGADPARQRVLQNLVRTISDKYFLLSRRVDLLLLRACGPRCAPTCSARPRFTTASPSPFPTPASSWPTTSTATAAPSPGS